MCKERYINPFTDFGFKRLFGSTASKEFLISFLNSLFEDPDPIVDISYRNVENMGLLPSDRWAIFDLYCTTDSGAHVIVEMQNAYQRYFMDRCIYYSSFPIQEAAKAGEWNFKLPKVYTIAFLNFTLPEFIGNPDFKHTVQLTDIETKKVFYDKLTYIYMEMPKFRKEITELEGAFDKWMYIIKNLPHLLETPSEMSEEIFTRFFKMAEIHAFSKQEREAYELSLKNMRDYNNTLKTAEEKGFNKGEAVGLEKGIEKGESQAYTKIVKHLHQQGKKIEEIGALTGLTPQQVEELL